VEKTTQIGTLRSVLTKYHPGDQIRKNEVGGACGTRGNKRVAYRVLMESSDKMKPFGRLRLIWEANIQTDF
jgi:hypothetical protein